MFKVIAIALALVPAALTAQNAPPPAAPIKPADAAALLGDWAIAGNGQQGPLAATLTLKVQDDKVVGLLTSEAMGTNIPSSVMKQGTDIIVRYAFEYQGNLVPVVLTLTPSGEQMKVWFDFADGAYTMEGMASKKK